MQAMSPPCKLLHLVTRVIIPTVSRHSKLYMYKINRDLAPERDPMCNLCNEIKWYHGMYVHHTNTYTPPQL
ncbi:hypothetical protein TWF569_003169 [Orbilia oligospora]|uniref:Uncharacterized protein n=1 Tax=Orbilia oligospora TaxID=2813651 RepID=A0A7C8J6X9_ORBOL|nr:hypothetical protein TWF102_005987 [Orbilia oligospora]KAF3124311.1 hypothetical protein TWF594_002060 [Orbilia oligospora]KAF3152124.1 hypothetical protein TWF569_003169 [Orbilia oligospora]